MTYARGTRRLAITLVTYVAWTAVTLDFGTFVASASSAASGPPIEVTQGWNWAIPILMVLPNFLFALYLLRNVRKDTRLSTD